LVIHEAWPLPGYCGDAIPGEVIPAPEGLAVATGEGALLLRQVQLEGKRPMTGQEFLRGQRHLLRRQLGF
jgi:methionyl-tRNA formyltransferase